MKKGSLILFLLIMLCGVLAAAGISAERLKFASSVKEVPPMYLPPLTAEEQGFWKQNGLEVEWVGFRSGPAFVQAVSARSLYMGITTAINFLQAASRGVPLIAVADVAGDPQWGVWVLAESRLKEAKDLKGTRIGVTRLGGAEYAYGRMTAKVLGLEKDIKFVGVGGITEYVAGLKAGSIHGVLTSSQVFVDLLLARVVRELLSVVAYLPKEWTGYLVVAHKEFVKQNPETVRRAVKSIAQAAKFLKDNPVWAMGKMRAVSGYSEEAARLMYEDLRPNAEGKVNKEGLENVRGFLLEYGIVTKEKAPPVDELFTNEFVS